MVSPPQQPLEADPPAGDKLHQAVAEAQRTPGLGRPGRPLNWRSPFFIGMTAAAGVAVTYGVVEIVLRARSVLVLIGLAMFIAAGLDPVVQWLCRWLPRWPAICLSTCTRCRISTPSLAA